MTDEQIQAAIKDGSLRTAIHHLHEIVVSFRKNQQPQLGNLRGAEEALIKIGVLAK